jgi:hypothetical protein
MHWLSARKAFSVRAWNDRQVLAGEMPITGKVPADATGSPFRPLSTLDRQGRLDQFTGSIQSNSVPGLKFQM